LSEPTRIAATAIDAAIADDEDGLIPAEKFRRDNAISSSTFYRILEAGELKAVKVGRRTAIRKSEARRWLASLPEFKPGEGV